MHRLIFLRLWRVNIKNRSVEMANCRVLYLSATRCLIRLFHLLKRTLIVTADDFGFSEGVNRGIIESHERGIVTSASLMVHGSAVEQAAEYCRRPDNELSVGLHFDAGEWFFDGVEWQPCYEVVDVEDVQRTLAELHRQLDQFCTLVGRIPTHIDSHQHVHRRDHLLQEFRRLGDELGIPVRHAGSRIRYVGSFYGQDDTGRSFPDRIRVESLLEYLRCLPEGVTELCCHPGYAEGIGFTMYKSEREIELQSLCSSAVREEMTRQEIELLGFADLPTD